MPRTSPIQNNFTAGELSPRLEGRVDFAKYFSGVRLLQNITVFPHGGATRRPGSRFVVETKDSTKKARLISFSFSVTQEYILEIGNQYIRFCRNEGQIVAFDTDASITNGTFDTDLTGWTAVSSTWNAAGYVDIAGVSATMTQAVSIGASFQSTFHVLKFQVLNNALVLRIGSTAGGTDIVADTTFQVGYHCFEFDPDSNATVHIRFQGVAAGTSSLDNVSLIDNTAIEIGSDYLEADLFQIKTAQSADVMWLVHPTYKPKKLTRTGHSSWSLTDFQPTSDPFTTTNNFPSTVAFYEERIFFAATNNDPQKLWGSKSADFENFTTGTGDDDSVQFTLAADQVNVIRWLNPGKLLMIGTVGGEWEMRGAAVGDPITPTNIQVIRSTTYGSANLSSLRVGNAVLFVQRAARKIRELVFSFDVDSFVAPDLTILSEHITQNGGITQQAYQQEPDSVVWSVRSDGTLLGMTYERPEDVIAWHRHVLGGNFSGGNSVVESVATVLSPNSDHNQVWITVKRTINSTTKRYIEFLENPMLEDTLQEDLFFVDSGLTYDGSPATVMTGLSHLEGESVDILADGAVHAPKTVSSGQITLDSAKSKVHIGLGSVADIETLNLETGSEDGTAQGKRKRIHHLILRFWRSLGVKVGPPDKALDVLPFRSASDPMDSAPALFTGDKKITFRGIYDRKGRVLIRQDQPLPLTILAIMPQLNTHDS